MATTAKHNFSTATLQEDTITLTPVRKRKVRPSWSPAKTVSEAKDEFNRMAKRHSDGPTRLNLLEPSPSYDIATAALDFKEFSFISKDGKCDMHNLSNSQQEALGSYLGDAYTATSMLIMPPFLHILCEKAPPEDQRPFTVAGLVAVWSDEEEGHTGSFFLGHFGEGEDVSLPDHIEKDIQDLKIPSDDTILYLAEHVFKDCISIAMVWNTLVVCLPEMSDFDFAARLRELPGDFRSELTFLYYHNGPMSRTELRRREIQPDPITITGQCDELDYVAADNRFYPGTMIQSCDENGPVNSVTAGILVSKNGETRLTASYHCWQDIIDKNPAIMKKGVPVYQGNIGNAVGTYVGDLVEHVGKSDIALVKLHQPLENSFMELDCSPKKLLHTDEVKIGDHFLIDSFVTGKQRLKCLGVNRPIGRGRRCGHAQLQGDPKELPDPNTPYITLKQGLYATNTPQIPGKPQIRAGVCGSVLLRCRIFKEKQLSSDEVLAKGEVSGIMHFADLRPNYSVLNNLMCYADSFDELISEGWKVAATI